MSIKKTVNGFAHDCKCSSPSLQRFRKLKIACSHTTNETRSLKRWRSRAELNAMTERHQVQMKLVHTQLEESSRLALGAV